MRAVACLPASRCSVSRGCGGDAPPPRDVPRRGRLARSQLRRQRPAGDQGRRGKAVPENIEAQSRRCSRSRWRARRRRIANSSSPTSRRVLRYRANGRPRRDFGGNGRAVIPTPAGMSFQLAGAAVDSRGRVLVAGTTKPIGASGGFAGCAGRASIASCPTASSTPASAIAASPATSSARCRRPGSSSNSQDRPVLTGLVSVLSLQFFCEHRSRPSTSTRPWSRD